MYTCPVVVAFVDVIAILIDPESPHGDRELSIYIKCIVIYFSIVILTRYDICIVQMYYLCSYIV